MPLNFLPITSQEPQLRPHAKDWDRKGSPSELSSPPILSVTASHSIQVRRTQQHGPGLPIPATRGPTAPDGKRIAYGQPRAKAIALCASGADMRAVAPFVMGLALPERSQ
jgi:hypothetical protein